MTGKVHTWHVSQARSISIAIAFASHKYTDTGTCQYARRERDGAASSEGGERAAEGFKLTTTHKMIRLTHIVPRPHSQTSTKSTAANHQPAASHFVECAASPTPWVLLFGPNFTRCASIPHPGSMIMADNTRKRKEDTAIDFGATSCDSESHGHLRNVQSMSELEHGHAGGLVYKLYSERWLQLLLLSCLALISDWVCFATAAIPAEFFEASGGHESSSLINSFFFANVVSCFLYTDVSRRFGLRNSTNAAGWAMAVGCLLRSGVPRMIGSLPPYIFVLLGTTLVGMAQPFFQCAPPLLSATWFSRSERSLATATALNANQLGIAAAFVVGGRLCAGRPTSIKPYLDVITLVSFAAALVTWCCFKERPPTPPTASAAARGVESEFSLSATQPQISAAVDKPAGAVELGALNKLARCLDRAGLTFHRSLYVLLFRTKGFLAPLAAFVTSIAVTNVLSAFAHDYLDRAGARVDLALVGAAFQVAIVLGGIVLGAFVDSTHTYKSTTLACLGVAIALLLVLAVACGYDAHLPAGVVVSAILALGSLPRHTLPFKQR